MKVSFLNRKLIIQFGCWLAWLSTMSSLLLIFFEIPDNCKAIIAIVFLIFLISLYLLLWHKANKLKIKTLSINGMSVTIREGNLFTADGFKIIPFNEYFDTKVDDKLISSKTLNGQYLLNYCHNTIELDNKISSDTRLNPQYIMGTNTERLDGKQLRYQLGSIYKNEDYLLLAFTKFDIQNRAYLDADDFFACLFNMWSQLDIVYGGFNINLPLIGTGITRKLGMNLTEQETLECILFTLKTCGITFSKKCKINIVIYRDDIDQIDFYGIKV